MPLHAIRLVSMILATSALIGGSVTPADANDRGVLDPSHSADVAPATLGSVSVDNTRGHTVDIGWVMLYSLSGRYPAYTAGTPTGYRITVAYGSITQTFERAEKGSNGDPDGYAWRPSQWNHLVLKNVPYATDLRATVTAYNAAGEAAPTSSETVSTMPPDAVTGVHVVQTKNPHRYTSLAWNKANGNGNTVGYYQVDVWQREQGKPFKKRSNATIGFLMHRSETTRIYFSGGMGGNCASRENRIRVRAVSIGADLRDIKGKWSKWLHITNHDPSRAIDGNFKSVYPAPLTCVR